MTPFAEFDARKTREAAEAAIHPLASRPEHRLSLVFVQSCDGNTGARNPADLGGGRRSFDFGRTVLSRRA